MGFLANVAITMHGLEHLDIPEATKARLLRWRSVSLYDEFAFQFILLNGKDVLDADVNLSLKASIYLDICSR